MKSKKNVVLNSHNENNKQIELAFYRLIFLGGKEVGKTQIINIYNNKLFENEYFPTFCVDFQIKTINFNGRKINIHCIDTGSIEFLEDTGNSFIEKADAFILVYDITSRLSFDNIFQYYEKIKLYIYDLKQNCNNKIIYLVGNKFDLRNHREVSENEARELGKKYNAKYLEVSAKNGLNIDRLFEYVLQDINQKDKVENIKNNNIYRNNSIYRNDNIAKNNNFLENINKNERFNENENGSNYDTSTNFLKTKDFINTTNYNINFQGIQNNEKIDKSYYYENTQKKCKIF